MSTQAAKRHAAREKRRRLLERIALVALAALLVFSATPVGRAFWDRLYALSGFRGPVEEAPLEIHFIDVGKADAILLRCQGQAALLDAGTYASGDRVVDYLRRMGVERLEYAIASHPDSDHTGGMAQVLEEIPVEALVVYPWPDEMRQTLEYRALEEASFSHGVPVKTVGPGTASLWGKRPWRCWARWRNMRRQTTVPWCCGWTIWAFPLCSAATLKPRRNWTW